MGNPPVPFPRGSIEPKYHVISCTSHEKRGSHATFQPVKLHTIGMLDRLGPLSARLDDKLFLGKERRRECSAADGREEADERGNSNMMSAEVASERMPKKRGMFPGGSGQKSDIFADILCECSPPFICARLPLREDRMRNAEKSLPTRSSTYDEV